MIDHAQDLLEQVKICDTRIQSCVAQDELMETIQIGLRILQQLGISLLQPSPENVQQALVEIAEKLENRPIKTIIDLLIN